MLVKIAAGSKRTPYPDPLIHGWWAVDRAAEGGDHSVIRGISSGNVIIDEVEHFSREMLNEVRDMFNADSNPNPQPRPTGRYVTGHATPLHTRSPRTVVDAAAVPARDWSRHYRAFD